MKQEALKYFQDTHLTGVAMLLFLAVFLGVLVTVLRRAGSARFEQMARLPLDEEIRDER